MGRSQESFHKKEVKKRKEKKRKDKEKKRLERKETSRSGLDDMIAHVDEFGRIVDTPPEPGVKTEQDPEEIEISVPRRDPGETKSSERTGSLRFFNTDKCYGFIHEDGSGQSIYVHVTDFQDDILEGDKVVFEVGKGQKGPAAFKVRKK
jgi:cold shock CspA family protein